MAYNGTDIQNAKAYALILDNSGDAENPVPMIFVRADSAPVVGQTYESEAFGALPVTAVYTDFENIDYYYNSSSDKLYPTWTSKTNANVTSVTVEDEIKPISTCAWFGTMGKCKAMNLRRLNTENVKSMNRMFFGCVNLTNLDIGNFNTNKVVDMGNMFYNCSGLATVDVSNFDTSNVTNMRSMFGAGTSNDVMKWETLDVSNFDTSNVTDMSAMFQKCSSLTSLDVSRFDTSNVTDMSYMFCVCTNLETLDVSNWKTGNVTNMSRMFNGCTNLETLDVSNWDVSKVTNMSGMFSTGDDYIGNGKLNNLDVSNWNTSSCTDMGWMFYGCGAQTYLDVSNWDVSKVKVFSHMFADNFKLQSLDVSKWTVESAESLDAIFNDCDSLTTIDVSNWRTAKNKEFSQMFESCDNLTTIIGLENFNTANGERFYEMFKNSVKLTSLNLSSFDTRKANDAYVAVNGDTGAAMQDMFGNMPSLKTVTLGENFDFDGNNCAIKAVLPTPVDNCIELADGNWYTEDGVSYAPANIPSRTAGTYYAYNKAVVDKDYLVKGGVALRLASVIRNKIGAVEKFTIDKMIDIIDKMDGSNIAVDSELDYIVCDGSQYFVTGIIPTPNTGFEYKINYNALGGKVFSSIDINYYSPILRRTGSELLVCRNGNDAGTSISFVSNVGEDYVIKAFVEDDAIYVNGELITTHPAGNQTSSIPLVFGRDSAEETNDVFKFKGKVYYLKIYENGELIADYIPYRRNGINGFYDNVGDTFISSKSNTSFIAGNIINENIYVISN